MVGNEDRFQKHGEDKGFLLNRLRRRQIYDVNKVATRKTKR